LIHDRGFFDMFVMLFALVASITVHEFAHAMAAVAAGDNTPKKQGRISLNPVDHFDPVGFLMIVFMTYTGFGIGWGKPVQVNPHNFGNPRWDDVKVSLWGPASNLIMAAVCAVTLRLAGNMLTDGLFTLFYMMVLVNVGLAMFNLIPLPPLDGSHILAGLLPAQQAREYARFASQWGMPILILLLVTGGLGMLIGPPRRAILSLLLGG